MQNLLEELLWGSGEVYRKPRPDVEADLAALGVHLQSELVRGEGRAWYLLDDASTAKARKAVDAVWHEETRRWTKS